MQRDALLLRWCRRNYWFAENPNKLRKNWVAKVLRLEVSE